MIGNILVCVDGSTASFHAARTAIELAAQLRGRLVLLSVVDPSRLEAAGLRGAARQREADARAALDRVARMAAERAVEVETRLRTGIAFEQILEESREGRADLIVMGSTGRRGPGSRLLGSSALHVAEFTETPLLLVPTAPAVRPPISHAG